MADVSPRGVKRRIRSMESTRQITRAMELVAAAKLRRAQDQLAHTQPYGQALQAAMESISRAAREIPVLYRKGSPGSKELYLLLSGDRGLAGGYYSGLFKFAAQQMMGGDPVVLPLGKKAREYALSQRLALYSPDPPLPAQPAAGDCFSMGKVLHQGFLAGEFGALTVLYTRFDSALTQTPAALRLLPLGFGSRKAARDILLEGEEEEVFPAIIPDYLGGMLYSLLWESRAAEEAARRAAMDTATKNAADLIDGLQLQFNRARQASITQEITQIISGI